MLEELQTPIEQAVILEHLKSTVLTLKGNHKLKVERFIQRAKEDQVG